MLLISTNFIVWERDGLLVPLGLSAQRIAADRVVGLVWADAGLQQAEAPGQAELVFIHPSELVINIKTYLPVQRIDELYFCLHGAEALPDFEHFVLAFPRKRLIPHFEASADGPVKQYLRQLVQSSWPMAQRAYWQATAALKSQLASKAAEVLREQIVGQHHLLESWEPCFQAGASLPFVWQQFFDRFPHLEGVFRTYQQAQTAESRARAVQQAVAWLRQA